MGADGVFEGVELLLFFRYATTAAFTMSVYGHVSAGMQAGAAQAFADLMSAQE